VIGYYVHHHGSGHRARYEAVASRLGSVVALSELQIDGGLRLPSDVPSGAADDPGAGGGLHWAPLHVEAADRLRVMVDWLASHRPVGVVVDVSVEAAITCRLAGVATVVVRQLGRRDDPAHELAFRSARLLVAPWPAELDDDAVPAWIRDKTDYVGYVRSDEPACRSHGRTAESLDVRATDVVVLWGRGGGRLSTRTLNAIAANCGGTVWCVGADVLDGDTAALAANVSVVGWRDDIDAILHNAPVTVASAGNNVIADAARWGCPLVLVPQPRPFDEQHVHAGRLAAIGAAVVVAEELDSESAWSESLCAARSCPGRLGALARPGGAIRFAAAVGRAFGAAS
jgi:UDP-N-acetylglucosamine--N-acetylmuramyl-(pentapeptide) pyrophosphoryl-undecaprenol N-acetylglucosamine transferase